MKSKIIQGIDFILIVGTLIGIFLSVGYVQPLVIGPIDGFETTESVLFEFEKANLILIDDNLEFTSPEKIYAENNLVVNLKPGIYYWKVEGALPGEIRQLTIISEISLKLKENENSFSLVNSGNTRLNVDIFEDGRKTREIILEVDEEKGVIGTKFIGGKDE